MTVIIITPSQVCVHEIETCPTIGSLADKISFSPSNILGCSLLRNWLVCFLLKRLQLVSANRSTQQTTSNPSTFYSRLTIVIITINHCVVYWPC